MEPFVSDGTATFLCYNISCVMFRHFATWEVLPAYDNYGRDEYEQKMVEMCGNPRSKDGSPDRSGNASGGSCHQSGRLKNDHWDILIGLCGVNADLSGRNSGSQGM